MEFISILVTFVAFTYLIIEVNREAIEYWWVQKKNKKYLKSELYKFQRAKVKQKFVNYYKDLGYIDPEFSAEEQVKLHERNQEIDSLYREFKEFKV